jgi:hypothetical protein
MFALRRFLPVVIAAITVVLLSDMSVRAQTGSYELTRVIVQFLDQTAPGEVDSLLGRHGVIAEHMLCDSSTFLVRIPIAWSVDTSLGVFRQLPPVAYAGPNYYCRVVESAQISQAFLDGDSDPFSTGVSPDDYYGQYAISTTAMAPGHLMARGAGQMIAQIDNGADFYHPLLAPRLSIDGYDFVDFDEYPSYQNGSCAGHGTFAAGLLALSAPEATILPIRSLDGNGVGTIFGVTLGIDYAIAAGAEILCLGFGVSTDDEVLRAAIGRAEAAGIITLAPAGNDGVNSMQYPAAYRAVIGVAAVDSLDLKADFSNYGICADICAPGVNLYSALPGGDVWGQWSGTSFSTPLAAGLAAMVRQLHPSIPVAACRRILEWGSDEIDSINPVYAGMLGNGRINFARSTGESAPVVAIWGWATDSTAAGIPDVTLSVLRDGMPLHKSATVTDGSGFYASALEVGTYDLLFAPPVGSGHQTTSYQALSMVTDTVVSVVLTASPPPDPCAQPGDLNRDGAADVFDITALIDCTFRNAPLPMPQNGCPIGCADTNCDGSVDVFDLVRLIDYVFSGGAPPYNTCM